MSHSHSTPSKPNHVTLAPPRRRAATSFEIPEGHMPIALREFIIKVYERCNLACDYCYMYEMADQTWQDRPVRMKQETFTQLSRRIAEHVIAHELEMITVVFHGGEPLLQGIGFYQFAHAQLRSDLPDNVSIQYRLQTNGILITEEILEAFLTLDIHVGVSLDGTQQANDRHRRYRNGSSSYDEVVRGIDLLAQERFRPLFSRLYSAVDIANDPIETYEHLASFSPPWVDFLLPHGNWHDLPPNLDPHSNETPYADWLIPIFDCWYNSQGSKAPVRLFTEIMNSLLGGASRFESIGLSPVALVSIDTDGSIEQVDTMKSAFHGAAQTGFDIWNNSLDEVMSHPSITFRQIGKAALCNTCLACPISSTCGAGYLPHRYSVENGFNNPSVFCKDLMKLITHINIALSADIQQAVQH